MHDVESLQAGLERDLQDIINDCSFNDPNQGTSDYQPNNDSTTQYYGTGDTSIYPTNFTGNMNNNFAVDVNSTLQSFPNQNLSKQIARKKSSPNISNPVIQSKGPNRERQTLKLSAPSKLGAISAITKENFVKSEESDDDKSLFDSDDGNLNKSRSSSIEDERAGSDNDTSKRKFPIKKPDAQNAREKNREHAKNTRMRKKNYIESLKENIKQLTDEREQSDLKRKASLSKLADQVRNISYHKSNRL